MDELHDGHEPIGAGLGARLARRFRGDADRLADVSRLLLRTGKLRPRSLFYLPPRAHGQHGVAILPDVEDDAVRASMVAVAVALHLDGTLAPVLYIDGEVEASPRLHAAHDFARGFLAVSEGAAPQRRKVAPPTPFRRRAAG